MELIVTFKSTHHGIYGENILLENSIPVKVMPLPSSIRAGCGICLRIPQDNLSISLKLLESSKVEFDRIYRKKDNNTYIEWTDNHG